MRCCNCGVDNPDKAKFCMDCGTPVGAACSQCGAALPQGARFCVECGAPAGANAGARSGAGNGAPRAPRPTRSYPEPAAYTPKHLAEKILKSKAAVEGERKQVTVMFADVCESMTLAESVDPEAWHSILDGFFSILSNGVHRFEGTINQYTGDGIMALFGAPIAHEDHAQRSCYAALHVSQQLATYADDVRRRHGLNFSVRIGINSGEVVVGSIGDDLRMDYTAQGHTVGLAARVEALAAPNTVYISETTEALVRGYFKLRDLGGHDVKGVSGQVGIFQLEGVGAAKTRLDVSRARGLTRFVGRDDEMARLDAAFERVREGEIQVVGVVAEAGAGKSRLCYEFTQRMRDRGIPVFEAHCVAHGSMIPYLPVLELLRGYLGVNEQDDDRTAREQIAGRLLLIDEAFKDDLPIIFDFLGVPDPDRPAPPMEPEALRKQLFAALERMLAAGEGEECAIILFEDLHWIDGASDAFLGGLISLLQKACDLVLVNTRPGYKASWMDEPFYSQIDLRPLDAESVTQLVRESLGGDASVQNLAGRIRKETGGNPFFIEEVIRALIERGTLEGEPGHYRLARPFEQVVIPSSVHDLIAARIDRLDEHDKEVLQTAAVIGKVFTESLLRSVTDMDEGELGGALDRLREGGFFDQGEVYPEIEYVFYHPLTQEVAYRTQLNERRSEMHRRVAIALESQCGSKCDDQSALLAHHWDGAGDHLKSLMWSRKAAEWAATRDMEEAQRHWQHILDTLDGCENCAESSELGLAARTALIEIGWKRGLPLEESKRLMESGIEIAKASGQESAIPRLIANYGMAELFVGHVEEGLARLREAERAAGETTDVDFLIHLRGRLAYMYVLTGHLAESLTMVDGVLALADRDGVEPAFGVGATMTNSSWFRAFKTLPLAYMGDLEAATKEFEPALESARKAADLASEATLSGFGVTLAWFKGDVASALTNAQHQFSIAETMRTPTLIAGASDSVAVALMMDGKYEQALEYAQRALSTAREVGTLLQSEAVFISNLAAAYLGCGNVEEALTHAREAVKIAADRSTPMFEIRARVVLARVLLAGGEAGREEAEEALIGALALVERTGARGYAPFLHFELARAARMRGDSAGGDDALAEATRQFREMGAGAHAERLGACGELAASM